jgi:ABC-type multidrug transport system fused ATPase/permease subunit
MIQVFFGLVEPTGGKIIIDGIDICMLGLHDLRSRFGIIPQERVLFEGTVRRNVDPVGRYSTDEEIWEVTTWFPFLDPLHIIIIIIIIIIIL